MLIRRIARPLLSTVFIGQGVDSLRNPQAAADAARPTMAGLRTLPEPVGTKVPDDAEKFARINAAVQIGGGILLAAGKMPRVASAVLACTVLPGNLGAHTFWNETDPERRARKRRDFMADLSLLGGLLIAAADTEGKPSLGWRGRRAAGRVSDTVSSALPHGGSSGSLLDSDFADKVEDLGEKIEHGLQTGADRGRELALTASEKSAPLVQKARKRARKRGSELAEIAAARGADLAETARHRGGELAETARHRGGELAETARHRGGELAETARHRGGELARTARKRVETQRKK